MAEKHCTHCRKLGTDECRKPWECIDHGFKYFASMRGRYCPKCRVKYKIAWTDPVEGSTVVYKYKRCPECGRQIRETTETHVLNEGAEALVTS